jgi:hypothetical protein
VYLLDELLLLFVLPLGVSLILLVWGLAKRHRGLILVAVIVLMASSNPFVGHALIRATEGCADR